MKLTWCEMVILTLTLTVMVKTKECALKRLVSHLQLTFHLQKITIVYRSYPIVNDVNCGRMEEESFAQRNIYGIKWIDINVRNIHFILLLKAKRETIFLAVTWIHTREILFELFKPREKDTLHLPERLNIIFVAPSAQELDDVTGRIVVPLYNQVFALLVGERVLAYEIYDPHMGAKVVRQLDPEWTIPLGEAQLFATRMDLQGVKLSAGIQQISPAIIMMPTTGPTKISGYIYEVWKELECLLNFTTDFKNSVDSYWGSKQPDGSWNGLIGMLLRREIDAAVTGLSTTHERRKVIDFTYTTYVRSFRVYFKLSNAQMTSSTLLKVTPWEVFYTLTAIVGVAAVVRGLPRAFGLRGKLGDTWAMFDLLYGFCSQGVPWRCYPTLTSDRIVLGVTQLSGLIVFNIYSATLISKYSVQNDFVMFDTLTELVNSRQYSIGVVQGTADIEILQTILEGSSLNNVLWVDDTASGMEMVCNSSFAFLTTYRLSDNLLTKESGPPCNPVYLQLSNVKDQLGIGVRKGWPYLRLFNYYLKRLDEAGVLVRLQTKWNVRGNEESTEKKQKSIDLKQVLPLFLLVCVGLVASWGWLLLEFTVNKRNRAARKPLHQRKGTIPLGLCQ